MRQRIDSDVLAWRSAGLKTRLYTSLMTRLYTSLKTRLYYV